MLLVTLLPTLFFSHSGIILAATVGVVATAVAMLVGRAVLRRRTTAAGESTSGKQDLNYDPFVIGSKLERRNCVRREGNPVEVLLADAKGQSQVGKGWVIDRSMGGLCVVSTKELEPGLIFTVKPTAAAGPVFWTQVEVRSCKQNGANFEVGCRFVKPPTWSQLLYYG